MRGTLIILQTTPFCNIDCKYCYLPNRSNKSQMSLETFEQIVDVTLRSPKVIDEVAFVHHAGEPLVLPKDFYRQTTEIIQHYSDKYNKKTKQALQTNATLIDREWITIFKECNIEIGVSVDGPSFIHDRNRVSRSGKSTHSKTMQGVRLLQESKVNFNAIMVLTSFALDYPDEIFNFFVDNRFKFVGINVDEFGATDHVSSYAKTDRDNVLKKYRMFMRRLIELVDLNQGKLVIREFSKTAASLIRDSHGQHQIFNGVRTPLNIINFDVNGNFSTFSPELINAKSQKYGDFLLGNVFENEIEDILNLEKFHNINTDIEIGVQMCRDNCDYWRFCGGGSPADKFYEFGRLDVAETTACKIHKKAMIDVYLEYLLDKRQTKQA